MTEKTGKAILASLIDPPREARFLYPTRKAFGDLDPAGLQVLIAVELLGQATVTALAQRLELELSSVSGALKQLRGKGYVRVGADADKRRRPHEPTPHGSAVVAAFVRDVQRRRAQRTKQEGKRT